MVLAHSKHESTQAILFRQLREHSQKRDRLRLIVDCRKKFLDTFVRGGDEETKQAHLTPALSPSDAEREKKPERSLFNPPNPVPDIRRAGGNSSSTTAR